MFHFSVFDIVILALFTRLVSHAGLSFELEPFRAADGAEAST